MQNTAWRRIELPAGFFRHQGVDPLIRNCIAAIKRGRVFVCHWIFAIYGVVVAVDLAAISIENSPQKNRS